MDNYNWLKEVPIAHRGYYNEQYEENSLEAFNNALEHGFNIELDLQLTKDLEIIVLHDLNIKRMTGIDKLASEINYDELKTYKLKNSNCYIPKFSEVLNLINGKVNLVIELKSINKKLNKILVQKTIETLKTYKGKYVLQSFNPFIMKEVRRIDKQIVRGQLVEEHYKNMPKIFSFCLSRMVTNIFSKPQYLNTDIHFTNHVIKSYLRKGKMVISYTAKNEEDYQKYLKIYDNVIFEKFDPSKIFGEQIIFQSKKNMIL